MDIKQTILNYVNSLEKFTTPSDISKELNISYQTVLKHIDILNAEGKIIIEDLGNNKIIFRKENE